MIDLTQSQLISGASTNESALKIQNCFKNFLLRKKIKRLKYTYKYYFLRTTSLLIEKFSNILKHWSCKMQIQGLKFLEFRKKRIVEIREKLAILSIKKAIQAKKFSIEAGRALYQKLNRKIKNLTHTNDSHVEFHNENILQLIQNLEDESNSTKEDLNKKKILQLTKAVYNIKQSSEFVIAPLSRHNFLQDSFDTIHKIPTEKVEKFRNLTISTPPMSNFKRFYNNSEAPPKLMLLSSETTMRPRRFSVKPQKVDNDMNFLRPTEIFIRKTSVDKQDDAKKLTLRPPSHRIRKGTFSSIAKRRAKQPVDLEGLRCKTMDRRVRRTSFSIPDWKTYEF